MDQDTQKNLLKLVSESYEKIAVLYDADRKKVWTPLFAELKRISGEIKSGQKVMDVGCGNGRLAEIFSGKGVEYLGVDKSRELIKLARQNHPSAQFVVGDILELSKIPDINFAYIFCAAVLHHLPGYDLRLAALKQLKNKIAADGKIVITVWNIWKQKKLRWKILKFALLKLLGKNKMDFGDIIFDWKDSAGEAVAKRYYHAFWKGELRGLVKKAGLKILSLYKDKYNYYLILSR